jgi:3-(3-hydroxy-phenyl)propionate hydroxylase
MVPGAPAADAPVRVRGRRGWLLDELGGQFDLLVFGPVASQWLDELRRTLHGELRVTLVAQRLTDHEAPGLRALEDAEGKVLLRYDGAPGTAYLLRPDQHVAARWRTPRVAEVREALLRAQGRGGH